MAMSGSSSALVDDDYIENELFKFCQQIDFALDKGSKLLPEDFKLEDESVAQVQKYFSVKPTSPQPPLDIQGDSKKRKAFLDRDAFHQFFLELKKTISDLNDHDIDSIYFEETPGNKAFMAIIKRFEDAGFYGANGRPIVFWSFDQAKYKADSLEDQLSDGTVPYNAILSKYGMLLKQNYERRKEQEMGRKETPEEKALSEQLLKAEREASDRVFHAASAALATQTTGDVIVYTAAINENEQKEMMSAGISGLITGNNFNTRRELPATQKRRKEGHVTNIYIRTYNIIGCDLLLNTLIGTDDSITSGIQANLVRATKDKKPMLIRVKNQNEKVYKYYLCADDNGDGNWTSREITNVNGLDKLPFNGKLERNPQDRKNRQFTDELAEQLHLKNEWSEPTNLNDPEKLFVVASRRKSEPNVAPQAALAVSATAPATPQAQSSLSVIPLSPTNIPPPPTPLTRVSSSAEKKAAAQNWQHTGERRNWILKHRLGSIMRDAQIFLALKTVFTTKESVDEHKQKAKELAEEQKTVVVHLPPQPANQTSTPTSSASTATSTSTSTSTPTSSAAPALASTANETKSQPVSSTSSETKQEPVRSQSDPVISEKMREIANKAHSNVKEYSKYAHTFISEKRAEAAENAASYRREAEETVKNIVADTENSKTPRK